MELELRQDGEAGWFTKEEFLDEYGDLERWEKAPRERRQDVDGEWYTLDEFEEEYNGLEEWELAERDPDIESDSSNYYSTTEEEFGAEVLDVKKEKKEKKKKKKKKKSKDKLVVSFNGKKKRFSRPRSVGAFGLIELKKVVAKRLNITVADDETLEIFVDTKEGRKRIERIEETQGLAKKQYLFAETIKKPVESEPEVTDPTVEAAAPEPEPAKLDPEAAAREAEREAQRILELQRHEPITEYGPTLIDLSTDDTDAIQGLDYMLNAMKKGVAGKIPYSITTLSRRMRKHLELVRERTDLADFSSVYYEETGFDHAQELMEPYLKKMYPRKVRIVPGLKQRKLRRIYFDSHKDNIHQRKGDDEKFNRNYAWAYFND